MLGVQAYLAGLTFALAASPCSTPVLATLLGYVATSRVIPFCLLVFERAGSNVLLCCSIKFLLNDMDNVMVLKTQDPIIGGSLLLTYTTGYVAPLIVAASFAGALQVIHVFLYSPSSELQISKFRNLIAFFFFYDESVFSSELTIVAKGFCMDQPYKVCLETLIT